MTQMFAQLIHSDGYLGMKDCIGKVFPVVARSPKGHYALKLKEGYCLNFNIDAIRLLQAVEEPAQKLEWKVGSKVLVKTSHFSGNHFTSRVGYVGTIEVVDGIGEDFRVKVKFPEASFAPPIEPSNYSSWWFKSELELVPDDCDGGKKPSYIRVNGKCFIAGDGKHLTKDFSKAALTKDYHKHLSDMLSSNLGDFYEEYRQGLYD
ncbi:hypothetical protein EC99P1_00044 [Enterococcus phage EC99P1]|nr:hypothetical protein EC99P1_00044 [Enterococcus phage EC99P1]